MKFRNASLALKLGIVQSIAISVLISVGIFLLTWMITRQMMDRNVAELKERNRIVVEMIDAYSKSLKQNTDRLANVFASSLPEKFSVDGSKHVTSGTASIPVLKAGSTTLSLNFAAVDRFTAITGCVATVFAREGDDFIRISTSLKKENGERAVGTPLGKGHPGYATLMAGQPYLGKARLFGKDYMTKYTPVKDESGRIIAILFIGLDFTDGMKSLKEKIRGVKIGDKGYIFVLDAGKEKGVAVIHPSAEGKNLLPLKDDSGREVFKDMLQTKEGVARYTLSDQGQEVSSSEKIVVFSTFEDWNWLIASGALESEMGQAGRNLQNSLFAASVVNLLLVILLLYYTSQRWIARPLLQAINAANSLAEGNLNVRIDSSSGDEAGRLLRAIKSVLDRLTPILHNISDTSKQMEQSSFQIAQISNEISESSEAQNASSEAVSNATNELRLASEAVLELADSTRGRNDEMKNEAERGMLAIRENLDKIQLTVDEVTRAAQDTAELQSLGDKIHDIIASITDIADQTNLLALNAAIEAARAGEHGHGFAVVADEVRNLASKTATEAKEITCIISALTGQVDKTMKTMQQVVDRVHDSEGKTRETATVIEHMMESAKESVTVNTRISEVNHSQMERLEQLQISLESLFSTIKESGTKVGITATISSDLTNVSQELNKLISNFTFEAVTTISRSEDDHRRYPRISNGLLTLVHPERQHLAIKGVTSDFSLSGLKLRLPSGTHLDTTKPLMLDIMVPCDSQEAFNQQKPLRVTTRIVWNRAQGDNSLFGLEFQQLTTLQESQIEDCIRYFSKEPRYQMHASSTSFT